VEKLRKMHGNKLRRLTIFIKSLQGGGAERSTVNLANALADAGISVDLLIMRANSPSAFRKYISDSVNIVELAESSLPAILRILIRKPLSLLYFIRLLFVPGSPKPAPAIPELVRYLRVKKPEVMLTALDYANIAAVAAVQLSGQSVRLVLGQRNQFTKEACNYPGWRVKQIVPTLRYFYQQADAIACVSKGVAADLMNSLDLGADQVHAIYNVVTTEALLAQASEPLDHPWFQDDKIPVLLAAGKLKQQKDYVTLLEAFSIVVKARDSRLVVLGQGPLKSDLEQLSCRLGLQDKVWFAGFVDNPFKYMRNADLFVLSSIFEGLPGVLIQALACGCPVVSTDCPSGPHEILDGGLYGQLVPIRDAPAMAAAILRELDTRRASEFLQSRGGFFSEENATRDYLEVLFPKPSGNTIAPEDRFEDASRSIIA
jgi:glycosyltransferase involved in cell wall biosynthesis